MNFSIEIGRLKIFYLSCLILLLSGCKNRNYLLLERAEIDADEIDTLNASPAKGIYLVNLIKNKAFGRFTMTYGVIKENKSGENIFYKINKSKKQSITTSAYYVAIVKRSESKWGWFYFENGMLQSNLPEMSRIRDSLKSKTPRDYFIRETRGYIDLIDNGKIVQTINYGHLRTKYKSIDFDSLGYKLYRLDGDSLKVVSNNTDNLFDQRNGVFFIPPPGYGVVRLFDKNEILQAIDSVSKLKQLPDLIRIKPIQETASK